MSHALPPKTKRGSGKWIVGVVLASAALVLLWFYHEATAVPEFYAHALAHSSATASPKVAADAIERDVLSVQNRLERAEPWQLILKEEEINAWLMTELAQKMPTALPKEVTDPRIVLRDGMVYFACKHQSIWGGVLSVGLVPTLTGKPNELAVRVQSFSLGRLPLPQKQYLDEISTAAAQANLPLRWQEQDGAAVALLTIPDRYENLRNRIVKVESLQVRSGELVVQGTAERSK